MAENISTKTEGLSDALPPKVSNKIFTDVANGSAFLKATGVELVSGDGEIIPAFETVDANDVEETGVKELTNPDFDSLALRPRKFYTAMTFSDELQEDHPEIVNRITARSGESIARGVDKAIASNRTIPGFTTLGGLTAVELDTRQDYFAEISTLQGAQVQNVASTAAIAHLRGLANLQGLDAFQIELNPNDPSQGTFMGYPLYVFQSNTPVMFTGDFVGQAEARKVGDPKVKFKYAGWEVNGVDIARRNMFVALVEQRITFGTNPMGKNFTKFVPASAS